MSRQGLRTVVPDGLRARETGPWVQDKSFYLERYLSLFTRGVGPKWRGKLCYIDLFSGPGRSVIRSTGEQVEGSPLIALSHNFAHYVFVDVPDVLAILEKRLAGHPKADRVSLIQGDCNDVIDTVRSMSPPNHLTLAFVDPTGLQIRFQTIQRLVFERKVDLLMTIQFGMGIRMNLRQYLRSEGSALTDFMGSENWREDIEEGGSLSQFGHRILDRYMRRLGELGYDTVRNREVPVRSDQNNLLLYFIVLASRHTRGKDFWDKATRIEPGGQRFLNYA